MNFFKLKTEVKNKYVSYGKVFCPALNSEIVFNSKGFHHITKKTDNDPRPIGDQINRLKLLDLTFEFVKYTNTFQEYEKVEAVDRKETEYWGLVAIYKEHKLKVILRKVGNGAIHFWSVIPAYTTSEKRDGKFKMKGDAELD